MHLLMYLQHALEHNYLPTYSAISEITYTIITAILLLPMVTFHLDIPFSQTTTHTN